MNNRNTVILSTAYFPPLSYFIALASADEVYLESHEAFQKQTYRNRCRIYASNGPLDLTLPVEKGDSHLITDISIDYSHPWLLQHQRAIVSAYRSSAFFEYYQDDIFDILDSGETKLFNLNTRLLLKFVELVGLRKEIKFTDEYVKTYADNVSDLRSMIHPKKVSPSIIQKDKHYYQVFAEKYGFINDLSILDLLFNEGPNAIAYLSSL